MQSRCFRQLAGRCLSLLIAASIGPLLAVEARANPLRDAFDADLRGRAQEAIERMRPLAEAGSVEAQAWLARLYKTGRLDARGGFVVPPDIVESLKWYSKAVEDKGPISILLLREFATMFESGYGVPKNFEEALKWYRVGAERGDPRAQHKLGILYRDGVRVPLDVEQAVYWLRRAADQNFAESQEALGYHYARSKHRDDTEAFRWFLKSAINRSQPDLQFIVADAYERGRGVEVDFAEAIRWYRLSAADGYGWRASFRLGELYEVGDGVGRDLNEAIRLYAEAANRGNARGQFRLALAYRNGEGVPKDDIRTLKWVMLAIDGTNNRFMPPPQSKYVTDPLEGGFAVEGLDKKDFAAACQLRDRLFSTLTGEQVGEAWSLVREFVVDLPTPRIIH